MPNPDKTVNIKSETGGQETIAKVIKDMREIVGSIDHRNQERAVICVDLHNTKDAFNSRVTALIPPDTQLLFCMGAVSALLDLALRAATLDSNAKAAGAIISMQRLIETPQPNEKMEGLPN